MDTDNKELTSTPKRKSNNSQGLNGYKNKHISQAITPYTLKYLYAQTLIDEGRTYSEIQLATGLCRETIARLKKGEIKVASHLVDIAKKHESQKLTTITHTILDAISASDLEKASLLQKTTAASQLIDKRRLIDGESTENVSVQSMAKTFSEYSDKLADRLKEIE